MFALPEITKMVKTNNKNIIPSRVNYQRIGLRKPLAAGFFIS